MGAYLLRRVGLAFITIWAISIISFLIIQLPPGDYITMYIAQMASSGSSVSEVEAQNLRIQYGLDRPLVVQYFKWISRVLRGDLGVALLYSRPVAHVIGDRLGLTIAVSLGAIILTWVIALPVGILSAVKQYSWVDYVCTFLGFIGLSIPNFLFALILMYAGFSFFNIQIGGLFSPEYLISPWSFKKFLDLLKHLPLPAVVLGLAGTAKMIRIMRANLLDELRKPYVMTARARGLSESRVILKYPVRVALNPFMSTIGYLLPQVVSGSVIISMVLSLPTVGPLLLSALMAQDMFLAGAIVLLLGILTVVGTFISDILLMLIDPRIRLGAAE
jgi:peptide/nickel transport system permease protein